MQDKAAVRKAVRSTLRALPAAALSSASASACTRALSLIGSATGISVYLAMPRGECETSILMSALFNSGKRVFVPRVEGDTRHDMRMLECTKDQLASFPRSKWGIPEPTNEQAKLMEDGLTNAAIDLVIVPAVAFDRNCLRLGQGRGYYDTFLEKLAAKRASLGLPPAKTIGLGLSEQLIDHVPVDPHDIPLDFVCLPEMTLSRGHPDAGNK